MNGKKQDVSVGKALEARWQAMYARLKAFHLKYGHSEVPRNWKEDRRLASWVKIQRGRLVKDSIPKHQIRLLNSLSFSWKLRERGTWEQRLAELNTFRAKHGHCNVPFRYPENPKLAAYGRSLRALRHQGRLSKERLRILDGLGFEWRFVVPVKIGKAKVTPTWHQRYRELLAFKAKHGHCNIPVRRYPYRAKLGQWVLSQRKRKVNGTLPPECELLLERTGFNWNPEEPGL